MMMFFGNVSRKLLFAGFGNAGASLEAVFEFE
jgi:hypothetical protein